MNEEVQKTPGSSIASLVLGLISLLCAWFGYGALISIITGIIGIILGALISIITGIIGIILGIKGNKIQQTGMGTAGIVLSIIGLVLSIIVFFACVLCIGGLIALDAATSY